MQVSKYLYKHFAQLNCHNLNYGVKITSAVLLQYVKALGFLAKKNTPFCRGQNYYILKVICIGIK